MKEIYKLRNDFTIIGLTGMMGCGCTKVANLMSKGQGDFFSNNDLRSPSDLSTKGEDNNIEYDKLIYFRKYQICYNFLSKNWKPFRVIDYKKVLILYALDSIIDSQSVSKVKEKILEFIISYFKKSSVNDTDYSKKVDFTLKELEEKMKMSKIEFDKLIKDFNEMKSVEGLINLTDHGKLQKLYEVFFNPRSAFSKFSNTILKMFSKKDAYIKTFFFHKVTNQIRSTGSVNTRLRKTNIENVYNIARLINRLIKAYKGTLSKNDSCQVVISSLKNSLEIMFFKERYSAFYLVAIHNDHPKDDLFRQIARAKKVNDITSTKLRDLDNTEYKTRDFKAGLFSSPDVENCIQKADIHLINNEAKFSKSLPIADYFSLREQLIKYLSLIYQPGLITPSNHERCMQIAFISKSNSGCISRQVGAVITDTTYAIKAVGWNDTPKKSVPCLLRSVSDIFENKHIPNDDKTYSDFEKSNSQFNYKEKVTGSGKTVINKDFVGRNFSNNLKLVYPSTPLTRLEHDGKNCSFCFKSLHNKFEGEENQVHTRSLHAEENAMLQISKYGGQGLKGGILFTTASPCELCSKKAYQLGIAEIIYIDKYPGISKDHVIGVGFESPTLVQFKGAIGRAYSKLFEPFVSYKDELSIYMNS